MNGAGAFGVAMVERNEADATVQSAIARNGVV